MSGKIPRVIRLPDEGYDARFCPACGEKMITYHGQADPARGWHKRYRQCRKCGKRYSTIELFMLPGRTGKLRPAGAVLKLNEEESEE